MLLIDLAILKIRKKNFIPELDYSPKIVIHLLLQNRGNLCQIRQCSGLLMTLCLGIICGVAQEPDGMLRIKTHLVACKVNTKTTVFLLCPLI